jgi:hypothetical protein
MCLSLTLHHNQPATRYDPTFITVTEFRESQLSELMVWA